jgi:Ser/Thr protein kinase RdoA (MazF antagonist)
MPHRELFSWLQHQYGLTAPLEISLLRSYTNDVYLVVSLTEKYVLKIYGLSWRGEEEIQYEIHLLDHLNKEGLLIAKPIRGRNREVVKQVRTILGEQLAVLFDFAVGDKPEPPFSNRLYLLFGEAIGRMHEFSNNFTTVYHRENIDLEYLIDRPLRMVLPLLGDRFQDAAYLQRLGNRLKNRLSALNRKGLDWGPIHGDASLDNLHVVNDDQVILYDFDSGGPGWRASDLQGWAIGFPEYQEGYAAFLSGYRQVRLIKDQDIEASWFLTLAWDIWVMKIDLERRILKHGQDAIDQYITEKIVLMRKREKYLK